MGELNPNLANDLPQNQMRIVSQRVDPDGIAVTITKVIWSRLASQAITPAESYAAGVWTKTTIEPISDLEANLVTEQRPLPGNAITKERVLASLSYEIEYRTMMLASSITVGESFNSGTGLLTKTEKEPITELVAWQVVTVRPLPAPWIYDISVDPETLNLMFNKRRKNYAANITPGAKVLTGSGATATASSMSGGGVAGVTIGGAGGTGYADLVSVAASAPAAGVGNRPAVIYLQSSLGNGVLDTVIIADPGNGYAGAPTLTINPASVIITERKNGRIYADPDEMDAQVPHEVVTVVPLGQTWGDVETIPLHYNAMFLAGDVTSGQPGFEYIQGLGQCLILIPARQRNVQAQVLYWFSIGPDSLPSSPALPGSPSVVDPTNLYNPTLCAWRLFFDFDVEDVYSDGGTYEGDGPVGDGAVSFSIDLPISNPTASTYQGYVVGGYYLPHDFSSKRFHGNIFINKALYVPAL